MECQLRRTKITRETEINKTGGDNDDSVVLMTIGGANTVYVVIYICIYIYIYMYIYVYI